MLVGGLLARTSKRIPRDPNTLKLEELIRIIKVVSYIPVRRFPPFRNAGLFSPEYSYLAYIYKSFRAKIKIDFFVKKLNLKDVFIEIKTEPFGTILYKKRIKGRNVKSGYQKDILNISRELPLNKATLRNLIKNFFSKEELDKNRLLHDVTVFLQSKSIL